MDSLRFYPVFVDNIAGSVGPQDLRTLFSAVGSVVDVIIVSSYGFVNLDSAMDARDAVSALNGASLHNRLLHVDFSEELKDFFSQARIPYEITTNPETGRIEYQHPRYPSDQRIESPFTDNYLHDTEALDERLRRVNQQLESLKDRDLHGRRGRKRSTSRSRDRHRSRSPLSRDRDRSYRDSRESSSYRDNSSERSTHYSRDDRHSQRRSREYEYERPRSPEIEMGPRDQYEIFVGGLNNPVSHIDVGQLYETFGKVVRVNVIKNYAFLTLLTDQDHAISAVSQTNGINFFGNRINVSFKKGSKHDSLNEALAPKQNQQLEPPQPPFLTQEVMVEAQNVMKAAMPELPAPVPSAFGLPTPVPVAPSAPSSSLVAPVEVAAPEPSPFNQGLLSQFVKGSQKTNWSVESDNKQFFDGYGDAPAEKREQKEDSPEIEEIFPEPSSSTVTATPVVQTPSAADLRLIMATVQQATRAPSPPLSTVSSTEGPEMVEDIADQADTSAPVLEGPRAQRVVHVSGLTSRVDDNEIRDMFSGYGQVSRIHNKLSYAFVNIYCSELLIVKCVCELDDTHIKGTRIRVSFKKGSYEDSQEFKDKYSEHIKQFTSPAHKRQLQFSNNRPQKVHLSQIGEGLKNMDMSLSLGPIETAYPQHQYQQEPQQYVDYLYEIKAVIQSIQNKIVILQFQHPFTQARTLAKIIPGQMYINGHTSLGLAIKANSVHTWPDMVKEFLQIGKELVTNLRRLSDKEMHEQKDKEKAIQWIIPQAWAEFQKPGEEETMLSLENMDSRIATGVVTKLFTSWGVLKNQDGEILFRSHHVYWDSAKLETTNCLVTNTELEVGDIVCCHYTRVGPDTDLSGVTRSVSLVALLVWTVNTQLDPWSFYTRPTYDAVRFLSTSSTLARQLPGELEGEHYNVSGVVLQLHLPSGGVVQLDADTIEQLGLAAGNSSRVSFHRSRVMVNGVRMTSEQRLDQEMVPGDKVTLDIVTNPSGAPFVFSECGWVAVSVRLHSVVRGVTISDDLKRKSERDSAGDCVSGRIVYLNPPQPEETGANGSVSGIAVVDTGQYMGQRVEFDRGVCVAFGQSLAKADLGQVFRYNDIVNIKLKPYNSYCVESLWIGFEIGNNWDGSLDPGQRSHLEFWLDKKKIPSTSFDQLLRGQWTARPYLPLIGQELTGEVISLVESETEAGVMSGAQVMTKCGRTVSVSREQVYVYCHSMASADLAYCIQPGDPVSLVCPPRYVSPAQGGSTASSSVVWLGGADSRPRYQGVANTVMVSDTTKTHLKLWLQTKKFGIAIFKALVEGNLPSRKAMMDVLVGQKGLNIETSLLKELKTKYGDKVMSSLLSMFRSQVPAVTIPGLSQERREVPPQQIRKEGQDNDPHHPPPPGEESDTLPSTTPLSIPIITSNYYSSNSVTATYSSGPKPPSSKPDSKSSSQTVSQLLSQAYPPPPPPPSDQYYQYYQHQ